MGEDKDRANIFFALIACLDKLRSTARPAQRENNDICMQGNGANDKEGAAGCGVTKI